jgi:hypothetical protein
MWKMTMIEPTLDDLLDDEIMTPIMRSAGVDVNELRARLAETAHRLTAQKPPRQPAARRRHESCCSF